MILVDGWVIGDVVSSVCPLGSLGRLACGVGSTISGGFLLVVV